MRQLNPGIHWSCGTRVDGNAAYWLGANKSFASARLSLDTLSSPDESLDGSPSRSIMDRLDFFEVAEGAEESDRELERGSLMEIVEARRPSSVGLFEVEACLRDVDRDRESAARVSSPEKLDESLTMKDEQSQLSELA